MKSVILFKTITTSFFVLLSYYGTCQQTEIEITKYYRKTVPDGKVWYISNNKMHTIAFSDGVFESGTACNAGLHSNPSYILGILCYDKTAQNSNVPQMIGFTIKSQPQWLHDDVYMIKPHFLIKDGLTDDILKYSLIWPYKNDEIVFYPGMVLQTYACINNFIIYERDMTKNDQKNFLDKIDKQKPVEPYKKERNK